MRIHGICTGFNVRLASSVLALCLLSSESAALPTGSNRQSRPTNSVARAESMLGVRAHNTVAPASLYAALAKLYVPSFSRQTGLACNACH